LLWEGRLLTMNLSCGRVKQLLLLLEFELKVCV